MSDVHHRRVNKRATDLKDREPGRPIRALRLERGISQTGLGNLIGVTFQQIPEVRKGNRIAAGRLHRLAETLKAPITFFYAESTITDDDAAIDSIEVRLGHAFSRIKDVKLREVLLKLAEKLAG